MSDETSKLGQPDGIHLMDGDGLIYIKGAEEEDIEVEGDTFRLGGWARGLDGTINFDKNEFYCMLGAVKQNGERHDPCDVFLFLTLREAKALGKFLCERIPDESKPAKPAEKSTPSTFRERVRTALLNMAHRL
jgi:hypothetical protein